MQMVLMKNYLFQEQYHFLFSMQMLPHLIFQQNFLIQTERLI